MIYTMKVLKIILPVLTLIFLRCSHDEVFPENGFEVPVINGFAMRDEAGNFIGHQGYYKPNIKLGNQGNDFMQSEYSFITFPNPAFNRFHLMFRTAENYEEKQVWLVRAVMHDPLGIPDIRIDDNVNLVVNTPLIKFTTDLNDAVLDVRNLPEGFYRIYVKINDHLLYDNLVIYRPEYKW